MEKVTKVYEPQCLRLFDEDAYIQSFDAVITGVAENKAGQVIVSFDRTAFFPEGGGQDADTGVITVNGESLRVTDVHEKEGQVWHTLSLSTEQQSFRETLLAEGSALHGQIDWPERFGRMQSHSGEHILSGLVHEAYGYENVGFHMGADVMTIDFSGPLTMEQLLDMEKQANEIVWADVKTDIHVYSEEEIKAVSYRSKKELIGNVRIVTFPGADSCACCGTHVSSTGQIGLIKVLSVEKFHEGVRIEMLCGKAAYTYMNRIWAENKEISVALKAKPEETAAAVLRIKEQNLAQSYEIGRWQEKHIQQVAEVHAGEGNIVLFEEDLSAEAVRRLCDALIQTGTGICFVLSGNDEDGYKYCIGQKDGDVRALVKELNSALNGRGGGRPYFAQGSVMAARTAIESWAGEKGLL